MDSISQYSHSLRMPAAILFAVQLTIVFVVCTTALVNLTLETGNQNLWTVLLTSCLGYVMPNPRLKTNKSSEVLVRPQTINTPSADDLNSDQNV